MLHLFYKCETALLVQSSNKYVLFTLIMIVYLMIMLMRCLKNYIKLNIFFCLNVLCSNS